MNRAPLAASVLAGILSVSLKPSLAQSRLLALIDAQLVDSIPRTVFGTFVRAGQFAFGLDVTLADGRKLAFGTRRADERRR